MSKTNLKVGDKVVMKIGKERDFLSGKVNEWTKEDGVSINLDNRIKKEYKRIIHDFGYLVVDTIHEDGTLCAVAPEDNEKYSDYWYPIHWMKKASDKRGTFDRKTNTTEFEVGDVLHFKTEIIKALKKDEKIGDPYVGGYMKKEALKANKLTVNWMDYTGGGQHIRFDEIGYVWDANWFEKVVKTENTEKELQSINKELKSTLEGKLLTIEKMQKELDFLCDQHEEDEQNLQKASKTIQKLRKDKEELKYKVETWFAKYERANQLFCDTNVKLASEQRHCAKLLDKEYKQNLKEELEMI